MASGRRWFRDHLPPEDIVGLGGLTERTNQLPVPKNLLPFKCPLHLRMPSAQFYAMVNREAICLAGGPVTQGNANYPPDPIWMSCNGDGPVAIYIAFRKNADIGAIPVPGIIQSPLFLTGHWPSICSGQLMMWTDHYG
jgi:hypothetical protein